MLVAHLKATERTFSRFLFHLDQIIFYFLIFVFFEKFSKKGKENFLQKNPKFLNSEGPNVKSNELTSKRNLTYCFLSVKPADGETGKFISRTISPHSFFFVTYKCKVSFESYKVAGHIRHVIDYHGRIRISEDIDGIINCI